MGGIDDLGEPAVTEMQLDWLDPVPDCGRAGQAAGLAPGSEAVVLLGEATGLKYQSDGGCSSAANAEIVKACF